MKDFDSFVKIFTDQLVDDVRKIKRRYYLVDEDTSRLAEKLDSDRTPHMMGLILGEKKKDFRPSLALLDILSKLSERKVFISEKAEWLFLCGRDVFAESIKKANVNRGLVLVQNSKDENLGYGLITGKKEHLSVKNILDKGDYLRREKN